MTITLPANRSIYSPIRGDNKLDQGLYVPPLSRATRVSKRGADRKAGDVSNCCGRTIKRRPGRSAHKASAG